MELLRDLIKKNLRNYGAELERFYNWYVPRLNKRNVEEKDIVTAGSLQQYLGRHTNNHSLFLFFRGELENIGRDQVCRKYLSILIPFMSFND